MLMQAAVMRRGRAESLLQAALDRNRNWIVSVFGIVSFMSLWCGLRVGVGSLCAVAMRRISRLILASVV